MTTTHSETIELIGVNFSLYVVVPKGTVLSCRECNKADDSLTAESVEGSSLAFQGIDDVHGCDGLPLGVLGVGDGITDDVLKENLQDTSGLLVDQAGDTLDTTSASQTTNSGLGDTLDVVSQYFPVTLCATLSKTFSSLTATRHSCCFC